MKQQSTNPIAYLFRHITFFALCGLLPACFLALCDNSATSATFWVDYFMGNVESSSFFSQYISAHLQLSHSLSWLDVLMLLVSWVLLTLGWSIMVYRTDRHMQLGIRIRDGLFAKSMSIALRVAVFIFMMFVINQLSLLLIVGIMYVMNYFIIDSVIGVTILVLTVAQKIMMFVLLYVFMVALPAIVAENYSLVSALGYSARLNAVRRDRSQAILVVSLSTLMYFVTLIVQLILPASVALVVVGLLLYAWITTMPAVVCARFVTDIDTQRKDVKNNLF